MQNIHQTVPSAPNPHSEPFANDTISIDTILKYLFCYLFGKGN